MKVHEDPLIRRSLVDLKVLLVGGDPRPNAIERIKTALRLEAAIHCPTRKSDASVWRFAARLRTPGLALVVCARGLTRTQHGSDLHDRCRELKLPLLNCNHLPHPNTLVAGIINARLTGAVLRRCEALKSSASLSIGGAA